MSPAYPTTEEQAERITAVLLEPLKRVGDLLAREVDALNAELAKVQADVAELGVRVERLGVLAGDDAGSHSVRVAHTGPIPVVDDACPDNDTGDELAPTFPALPRWFYPCFCRVCGHSFESTDRAPACPECNSRASDVAVGPLTGVGAS